MALDDIVANIHKDQFTEAVINLQQLDTQAHPIDTKVDGLYVLEHIFSKLKDAYADKDDERVKQCLRVIWEIHQKGFDFNAPLTPDYETQKLTGIDVQFMNSTDMLLVYGHEDIAYHGMAMNTCAQEILRVFTEYPDIEGVPNNASDLISQKILSGIPNETIPNAGPINQYKGYDPGRVYGTLAEQARGEQTAHDVQLHRRTGRYLRDLQARYPDIKVREELEDLHRAMIDFRDNHADARYSPSIINAAIRFLATRARANDIAPDGVTSNSIEDFLAITWKALKENYDGEKLLDTPLSEEDKLDKLRTLTQALMSIIRGYNREVDEVDSKESIFSEIEIVQDSQLGDVEVEKTLPQTPDDMSCGQGSYTKLLKVLQGIHPDYPFDEVAPRLADLQSEVKQAYITFYKQSNFIEKELIKSAFKFLDDDSNDLELVDFFEFFEQKENGKYELKKEPVEIGDKTYLLKQDGFYLIEGDKEEKAPNQFEMMVVVNMISEVAKLARKSIKNTYGIRATNENPRDDDVRAYEGDVKDALGAYGLAYSTELIESEVEKPIIVKWQEISEYLSHRDRVEEEELKMIIPCLINLPAKDLVQSSSEHISIFSQCWRLNHSELISKINHIVGQDQSIDMKQVKRSAVRELALDNEKGENNQVIAQLFDELPFEQLLSMQDQEKVTLFELLCSSNEEAFDLIVNQYGKDIVFDPQHRPVSDFISRQIILNNQAFIKKHQENYDYIQPIDCVDYALSNALNAAKTNPRDYKKYIDYILSALNADQVKFADLNLESYLKVLDINLEVMSWERLSDWVKYIDFDTLSPDTKQNILTKLCDKYPPTHPDSKYMVLLLTDKVSLDEIKAVRGDFKPAEVATFLLHSTDEHEVDIFLGMTAPQELFQSLGVNKEFFSRTEMPQIFLDVLKEEKSHLYEKLATYLQLDEQQMQYIIYELTSTRRANPSAIQFLVSKLDYDGLNFKKGHFDDSVFLKALDYLDGQALSDMLEHYGFDRMNSLLEMKSKKHPKLQERCPNFYAEFHKLALERERFVEGMESAIANINDIQSEDAFNEALNYCLDMPNSSAKTKRLEQIIGASTIGLVSANTAQHFLDSYMMSVVNHDIFFSEHHQISLMNDGLLVILDRGASQLTAENYIKIFNFFVKNNSKKRAMHMINQASLNQLEPADAKQVFDYLLRHFKYEEISDRVDIGKLDKLNEIFDNASQDFEQFIELLQSSPSSTLKKYEARLMLWLAHPEVIGPVSEDQLNALLANIKDEQVIQAVFDSGIEVQADPQHKHAVSVTSYFQHKDSSFFQSLDTNHAYSQAARSKIAELEPAPEQSESLLNRKRSILSLKDSQNLSPSTDESPSDLKSVNLPDSEIAHQPNAAKALPSSLSVLESTMENLAQTMADSHASLATQIQTFEQQQTKKGRSKLWNKDTEHQRIAELEKQLENLSLGISEFEKVRRQIYQEKPANTDAEQAISRATENFHNILDQTKLDKQLRMDFKVTLNPLDEISNKVKIERGRRPKA